MGKSVLARAAEPRGWDEALLLDAGLLAESDHALTMAGVGLDAVVATFGTPTFVYNTDVIAERYRCYVTAFAECGIPLRVRYAVKANSNVAILGMLASEGAGADIVSGGELARALHAGVPPADIVFSGVGKTTTELHEAMGHGIGAIHLESLEEIGRVAQVAGAGRYQIDVGIRVNPGVMTETHPYVSTSQVGIKFGIPLDQVAEAAQAIEAAPGLTLTTLGIHLGSQLFDVAPYVDALERVLTARAELEERGLGTSLRILDIGGGLGVRYHKESPITPSHFAGSLAPLLKRSGLSIQAEPGRWLTAPAGVLLTEVLYRKHSGGKDFLIVDAGMNDLMRPSLYRAYHHILPLVAHPGTPRPVDVVGPVCETGDWIAMERSLPPLPSGSHVAILGTGAYAFSMGSNYNARRRPAEVVVSQGRMALARRRESYEDLYRGESPNPWPSSTDRT